jgi:hypothetical protein
MTRSIQIQFTLASILLTGGVAQASFIDEFNYPAGSAFPGYYTGTAAVNGSSASFTGTRLAVNASDSVGSTFGGTVPSFEISTTNVGSTWKISTTLGANWFTSANVPKTSGRSYPSGGLAIYTDTGNRFLLNIKSETKDASNASSFGTVYLESSYFRSSPAISGNAWVNYYSRRVSLSNSVVDLYTINLEKLANGNIVITSNIGTGGTDQSVLMTLTPSGGTANTGTSVTSSVFTAANAANAYAFLNSIGGKKLGFFTDAQDYATIAGNTVDFDMFFDRVELTNLQPIPEPTTLAALGAASLVLLRRRPM